LTRRLQLALLGLSLAMPLTALQPQGATAQASITAEEWSAYREKFLDPAGRIIDTANGRISHSEGQGYGLLLAYLAENQGDFDLIWAFTRTEMLLRDDGLAVWKWDPSANPHVSDTNNATDGDLLIAYAAALAGSTWGRPDLTTQAAAIADSLARHGIETADGMVMLKPGSVGFSKEDRDDGPVVNPSYVVFEATKTLAELRPAGPWNDLSRDGVRLIGLSMQIGKAGLPPDWVSLAGKPAPAEGLPQEFGYNAVRIPLYMLRAGMRDRAILREIKMNMTDASGAVRLVDIESGSTRTLLNDPGYRIIPALIGCVLEKSDIAEDLRTFTPTEYYPSTLHLLALSHLRRREPGCL
jgi:endo-1,4-beta-D-glucanase Y